MPAFTCECERERCCQYPEAESSEVVEDSHAVCSEKLEKKKRNGKNKDKRANVFTVTWRLKSGW